jgi:hypothetical protein
MTSVEFLFNELWETPKDKFTWYSILSKAQEMHKQEIINTYRDGRSDQQSERPSKFYNRMSEQYYQETFVSKGSDKKD